MIPLRVEIENFLAYGDRVSFDFESSPLWLLRGPNGVGKSAVFDAILLALFNRHRGGGTDFKSLIRHGREFFRVAFTFASGGEVYRVTRAHGRGTVKKLDRRVGPDEWETVKTDDIAEWVKERLGMTHVVFTSSTLLLQGQGDALLTAKGSVKGDLLRSLIDVKPYVALHAAVREKSREVAAALAAAKKAAADEEIIADEQLAAAALAFTDAERFDADARTAATEAARRCERARQWQALQQRRSRCEADAHAIGARAARAAEIAANADRLDVLDDGLPGLLRLIDIEAGLASKDREAESGIVESRNLETARDAAKAACAAAEARVAPTAEARVTAERKATAAAALPKELARAVKLAEERDEAAAELAKHPEVGDDEIRAAKELADAAARLAAMHRDEATRAATLLAQAKARRERLSAVGVGGTCDHCGQEVSAGHAEALARELADEVSKHEAAERAAKAGEKAAEDEKALAEKRRKELETRRRSRERAKDKFDDKQEALAALGMGEDAAALKENHHAAVEAAKAAEEAASAARTEATRASDTASAARKALDGAASALTALATRLALLDADRARDRAEAAQLCGDLPDGWAEHRAEVGFAEKLGEEQNRLVAADARGERRLREGDSVRKSALAEQLRDIDSQESQIDPDDRINPSDADTRLAAANAAAATTRAARDAAARAKDDLDRRHAGQQTRARNLRILEGEAALHAKLDGLLGTKGLQRELVRSAEKQVVGYADATLRTLSDGDLRMECAPTDDEESALDIRVYRAGSSGAIGGEYLSGGQKFRVALALALGIGRFAGQGLRRQEAIIIDEGFASLDREGLAAAATVLRELSSYLKIVVVSHQEEFADRFSVGYRLTPGEKGTTAAEFRA